MLGADGRARVMDFGLARAEQDVAMYEFADQFATERLEHPALAMRLTHTGATMGTPAYMSPEQFHSAEVTAAADQFSFCVTLWEALFGQRPFAGSTVVELATNVLAGALQSPPRGSRAPRWLRRICERGLAVEPRMRWPSMAALLHELRRGHARERMRRWSAALGLGLVLAAAAVGFRRYEVVRNTEACILEGEIMATLWNPAVQQAVRDGILSTGVSYAGTTAERLFPWLDRYASDWKAHRTFVCLGARVREDYSEDTLDRANWCLDERRLEFEALVRELSHADAQVVQKATTVAMRLPPSAPCIQQAHLEALPPPPPAAVRADVADIRAELARASTLIATAHYPEARTLLEAGLERAGPLQWPPLTAAIRRVQGRLLAMTGSYAEAESVGISAYTESAKARAWEIAGDVAIDMISVVGNHAARPVEGRIWGEHAGVMEALAGDPAGLRKARRSGNLAAVYEDQGDYQNAEQLYEQAIAIQVHALGAKHSDVAMSLNGLAGLYDITGRYPEAIAMHQRALDILQTAMGPDHPDVAISLNNLASVYDITGNHTEALQLYQRALAIKTQALGPNHPSVGATLDNLGVVHYSLGNLAEAIALIQQALEIREAAFGPDHPHVASSLNNLANVVDSSGDHAKAAVLIERALRIWERALGPEHDKVAVALGNLADVYTSLGDHAAARNRYERALGILEKSLGPAHVDTAAVLNNLASVVNSMGEPREAKRLYERALAIWETALGADHWLVASPLVGLAGIALTDRRPTDAIPLAERALQMREHGGAAPHLVAEVQFLLARALWDAKADPARAVLLAQQAAEAYAASPGRETVLTEVRKWLVGHTRPASATRMKSP